MLSRVHGGALDIMTKPVILVPDDKGIHNASDYAARLDKAKTYRDLSTVWLSPTRGPISYRTVQAFMGLMRPMNQKVVGPIFLKGMEVGQAYNEGIKMVLENPDLAKYKFLLTVEDDNCPPPDGLLKLYEAIDGYDVIGGLYWTKGPDGQPMCYGDPDVTPMNFVPQKPVENGLTPCNGLGMGFNLWRLDMFRDKRFEYGKWFQTLQEWTPQGGKAYTQDLYFFEKAKSFGYKFACDSRVKVGHWDAENEVMW